MSRARDIKELIAEKTANPADRRAMEFMAERLEETLEHEVPYRPEFKAELRRQIMVQARSTLTPWYKRPAFWGSSMALAAAAAVLAIGLQLSQTGPSPAVPPGVAESQPGGPGIVSTPAPMLTPTLVGKTNLPAVTLADEPLAAGAGIPAAADADLSQGLKVYRLTGHPNRGQFADMAGRLGFTTQVTEADGGFRVDQGPRSLQMTPEGQVFFRDAEADGRQGALPAPADAVAAAREFLDRAMLPVPELTPQVHPNGTVVYTPRFQGRPVVNGRTAVRVAHGGVAEAGAFVQTGFDEVGAYEALSREKALEMAGAGGGSFSGADLVWVRTVVEQSTYLQPYWRVLGTDRQGARVARYVPALDR